MSHPRGVTARCNSSAPGNQSRSAERPGLAPRGHGTVGSPARRILGRIHRRRSRPGPGPARRRTHRLVGAAGAAPPRHGRNCSSPRSGTVRPSTWAGKRAGGPQRGAGCRAGMQQQESQRGLGAHCTACQRLLAGCCSSSKRVLTACIFLSSRSARYRGSRAAAGRCLPHRTRPRSARAAGGCSGTSRPCH